MNSVVLQSSALFAVVFAAMFWFLGDPNPSSKTNTAPVVAVLAPTPAVIRDDARMAFSDLGNLNDLAELAKMQGRIGGWKLIVDDDQDRNEIRLEILKSANELDKDRCSKTGRQRLMKVYHKYLWAIKSWYMTDKPDIWRTKDDKLIKGILSGLAINRYIIREDFPGLLEIVYGDLIIPDQKMHQRFTFDRKWRAQRKTCAS